MVRRVVWSEDSLRDRKGIAKYWQWRLGNKKYASKLDKKFRDMARVMMTESRLCECGTAEEIPTI